MASPVSPACSNGALRPGRRRRRSPVASIVTAPRSGEPGLVEPTAPPTAPPSVTGAAMARDRAVARPNAAPEARPTDLELVRIVRHAGAGPGPFGTPRPAIRVEAIFLGIPPTTRSRRRPGCRTVVACRVWVDAAGNRTAPRAPHRAPCRAAAIAVIPAQPAPTTRTSTSHRSSTASVTLRLPHTRPGAGAHGLRCLIAPSIRRPRAAPRPTNALRQRRDTRPLRRHPPAGRNRR